MKTDKIRHPILNINFKPIFPLQSDQTVIECGYSKTARTIGDLTGFKLSKRKKRNEPLPPILPPAGRWHYIVLTRVLTSLSLQKTKSVIALTDRFPSLT